MGAIKRIGTKEMRIPYIALNSIGATTAKTEVSRRVSYPFRIRKIKIHFPIGCEYNVRVKVFISNDTHTADDIEPTGLDVFELLANNEPVRGNDEVLEIECDVRVRDRGKYIHVYALNTDVNSHNILSVVEIETLKGAY